jgi:hypothetical protein
MPRQHAVTAMRDQVVVAEAVDDEQDDIAAREARRRQSAQRWIQPVLGAKRLRDRSHEVDDATPVVVGHDHGAGSRVNLARRVAESGSLGNSWASFVAWQREQ